MKKTRKYGKEPFELAVLHGGPGALGDVRSLAKGLSFSHGVLEPLFDQKSIEEQSEWLENELVLHGELPVTLVGHSWGAWLGWIFAAEHPDYVEKLILVSSGPFEDKYINEMKKTLAERMSSEDKREFYKLEDMFEKDGDEIWLGEYGKLITELSSYELIEDDEFEVNVHDEVNRSVWKEAEELRSSGELLELGEEIECPVVAVHGEYDHHPYEGVKEPLEKVLNDFRFVLLEKCGHYPWREKYAKREFYRVLKDEL